MPPIRWTASARTSIDPRRGAGDSAYKPPRSKLPAGQALEDEVRAQLARRAESLRQSEHGDRDLEPAAGALWMNVARYRQNILALPERYRPTSPPEIEVQAAAGAVLDDGFDALVAYWCERHGVAFAVDALLRARRLGIRWDGHHHYGLVHVPPGATERRLLAPRLAGLRLLRRALAAADDAQHAAARAIAARHRDEGADVATRCVTAFLFPTEEAWVALDAPDALAAEPRVPLCALLLAAPLEPALATELVTAGEKEIGAALAFTLVDLHGAHAVGPLAALLAYARAHGEPATRAVRPAALAALALIETEPAARQLAQHLNDSAERRVSEPYFRRIPAALALAALGELTNAHARAIATERAAEAGARVTAASAAPPDRIAWTERARAAVLPRRGPGATAPVRERERIAAGVASAFGAHAEVWRRGEARAKAEPRRLMVALRERHTAADAILAHARLEPDVQAAAAAIETGGHAPAGWVDYWVAWEGLEFALDVIARSVRLRGEVAYDRAEARWLAPADDPLAHRIAHARRLRAHLAAADAPSYARAVARAAALREGAGLGLRCTLAVAFPDEAAWSAADAREWLAWRGAEGEGAPYCGAALLASLADAALAQQVAVHAARARRTLLIEDCYATLLDRLGWDAAPIFRALIELADRAEAQLRVLETAELLEGAAGARAIAAAVAGRNRDVRKRAEEYFLRLPHLAPAALLPDIAAGGAAGEAAAALLRRVVSEQPDAVARARGGLDRDTAAALARFEASAPTAPASRRRAAAAATKRG